jgi:hypothetical protein
MKKRFASPFYRAPRGIITHQASLSTLNAFYYGGKSKSDGFRFSHFVNEAPFYFAASFLSHNFKC